MRPNSIIQVTKSDELPIPIQDVKAYLKITHNHDDELINMLISSISSKCEMYTGLSLISKEWRLEYTEFNNKLHIPIRPLKSVTSIKVMHTYDSFIMLPHGSYIISGDCILINGSVPNGKIYVYCTAGFGEDHTSIPSELKLIMISHIADLYETRGSKSNFTMEDYNDFRFLKI